MSASGGRCAKQAVVDMIRMAVLRSGGTANDAQGDWVISGHTFRITGARTLSKWGLGPITIQLLGRWGSNAVLGYLAETPLLSFSDRLCNRIDSLGNLSGFVKSTDMEDADKAAASADRSELRREIEEIKKRLSDVASSLEGVSQVVDKRQVREVWWVLNDTSKVLHEAIVDLGVPSVVGNLQVSP